MSSSLSADQRKMLVRSYFERAWDTQETDERSDAPRLAVAPDGEQQPLSSCVDELDLPGSFACIYLGGERLYTPFAEIRKAVRTALPDLHLTIADLVVEGEKVVMRWLVQGTDLGGYEGHLPTGRSIHLTGITIMRMQDHTIVEAWNEVDIAGMLRQLGFVSVPQPPKITVRRPGPTPLSHL